MNRQERRTAGKGHSNQRIVLTGLVAHFENGQYTSLDVNKIQIIDRDTGRPLFDEVLEVIGVDPAQSGGDRSVEPTTPHQEFAAEPDEQNYAVEFDTPEGRMVYVKKGNWSGVKPA